MTNEEIKKGLRLCANSFSCDGCLYRDNISDCSGVLKRNAIDRITEQEKEIGQLKTALNWYINMYGCRIERGVYDDNVEYSCNGYIANEEEAVALLEAKRMLDWFC